ncbi:energy transducer TonB [Fluviicola sp.]|uniref:energy transducer TonB n=1 Tax=Fluviicola sp. TaxID=1917219 RepID=UPI0031DBEBCD
MRSLVFLMFLLGSVHTFGQSAKKLNKKLLAELAEEEQKQDSAYLVFTKSEVEYDSIRDLVRKKIRTVSMEEQEVRNLWDDFLQVDNQLKGLGVSSESVIGNYPQKEDGFPKHRDVIAPLKKTSDKKVAFEKVSPFFFVDKAFKLKELNPLLSEKLDEYRHYAKMNAVKQDQMERSIREFAFFSPKLDSLSHIYQLLADEVRTKGGKLHDKLDELRSNYIAKGPKGFPEAYRKVFYDAFPPPQYETIEEALKNNHSELAERYDEVGPAEPESRIYEETDVEEYADFPGGWKRMKEFISTNLRYPEKIKEKALEDRVMLRCVISETGSISDIRVVKHFPDCKECDQEAIRVVKLMPDWIPAKFKSRPVKSYVMISVWFKS